MKAERSSNIDAPLLQTLSRLRQRYTTAAIIEALCDAERVAVLCNLQRSPEHNTKLAREIAARNRRLNP